MDNSFAVQDHFPAIYKITLDNHRELLDLYTEILSDNSAGDVNHKLAHHVGQSIEPTDWTGIWRASVVQAPEPSTSANSCNTSQVVIKCDFEVEVIDVTHTTLEAVVIIRKLLSPVADRLTTGQFDLIEDFMEKEKVKTVPLIELYVISEKDEDERLLPTAVVIEQCRFYQRFISRPWDDLTSDASEAKIAARLEPRITLYFDMKHKLLPESTIKKISKILTEGRKLRKEFDAISHKVEVKHKSFADDEADRMSQGNEEEDTADLIDETEFYQAMRLKLKLEDLQRQLEMIEDPYMRLVATATSNEDEDGEISDSNKVHILAKKVTKSVMQLISNKLSSPADEEIELSFHKTFAHLLKSCNSGDRVLILPGSYVCDALPWIEVDLEIIGLTEDPAQVVLQSTESVGDVFINCNASAIRMQNITIRTPVETQSVIMVHTGITDLINCIVDGGKVARNTLVALSKADVAMDNCKIIHKDSTGKTPARHTAGKDKSPPRTGICRKPGGNVSIDGTSVSFVNDDDEDEDHTGAAVAEEMESMATDYDSDVMSINSEVKILNTMCNKLPQSIRSDYC